MECPTCKKELVRKPKEAASAFAKRKFCDRQCSGHREQMSGTKEYESRFGGGWITASQFLAESMCDRIARKDGIRLTHRFWDVGEWKQNFLVQLRAAASLLKKYPMKAIINALRTPQGKKVFSLNAVWFYPKFLEQANLLQEQEALALAGEPHTPTEQTNTAPVPNLRQREESQSLVSKLKGL